MRNGDAEVWCLLIAASGAAWEQVALSLADGDPDLVVIKRCVDVTDLLGAATTGQADVALVALDAPGLDQSAVDHLARHRVRLLAVDGGGGSADAADVTRMRASRLGITELLAESELASLKERLTQAAGPAGDAEVDAPAPAVGHLDPQSLDQSDAGVGSGAGPGVVPGRVVAVWGPAGAPGRTTVAVGLAGVLAARRQPVVLVDADPYGGAIAQQLGIVEEVSGVLAAARHAAAGELPERLPQAMREVAGIGVLSGLPRPDRWSEVRPGTVQHVAELATRMGQVVIDTGFSLEDSGPGDYGTRPPRNSMTLGALEVADHIVIVAGGDPVGLARLARGAAELAEAAPGTPVRVVINRMRGSLGWSERQIVDLVGGFVQAPVSFLPEDRSGADRALVLGVPLTAGPVGTALADLADELWPELRPGGRQRRRARRR